MRKISRSGVQEKLANITRQLAESIVVLVQGLVNSGWFTSQGRVVSTASNSLLQREAEFGSELLDASIANLPRFI